MPCQNPTKKEEKEFPGSTWWLNVPRSASKRTDANRSTSMAEKQLGEEFTVGCMRRKNTKISKLKKQKQE